MKKIKNDTFTDAVSILDDVFLEEAALARRDAGAKKRATVLSHRVLLIAAAAALVIAAVMIPLAVMMNKAPDPATQPPVATGSTESKTETSSSAISPTDDPTVTGHSFVTDKEPFDLPGLGNSADRLSYSGLHSFVFDGKTYLFFDEASALYSVDSGEFFGGQRRAAGARNGDFWERFIETGVFKDGYFYYSCDNYTVIDRDRNHGVVRRNIVTGEDEWYIRTEYAVVGMHFSGDTLYLAENGHFGYMKETDEGRYLIPTVRIYSADLSSGTFALLLDTGLEGVAFYEQNGEVTLLFSKDGCRYQMALDGTATQVFTPEPSEIEGKKYRYSSYNYTGSGKKTYVYEITENGEVLIFEDEAPYPQQARIIGDTLDAMTIYKGKLVAVRSYSLLLIDLETDAETVLLTDICHEPEDYPKDVVPPSLFSKTVVEGKLYFVDNTTKTLYVFDGETLIGQNAV